MHIIAMWKLFKSAVMFPVVVYAAGQHQHLALFCSEDDWPNLANSLPIPKI